MEDMRNVKWNASAPAIAVGDYSVTQINTDEKFHEIVNRIQYPIDFLKDKVVKRELYLFTIANSFLDEVAILCLEVDFRNITIIDIQTIWGSDDLIDEITDVSEIGDKEHYKELNKEVEHVAYEILRLIKTDKNNG